MKWLVVINDEGIQAKILVGRDLGKAAEEQRRRSLGEKQNKIVFIFESGGKNPEDSSEFREWFNKTNVELHKEYGASSPSEFFGYNLRKQYAMANGMEVLADLDAKDFGEFAKKYSGIQGAIDILYNTEKVMSGNYSRENPSKSVTKLIRKLKIEAEED